MFVFLALTMNMGHVVGDKLTDYLATMDQLYTPFYSTMMKWDHFLHILIYLQFIDNRTEPDRTDENFDRPWKIQIVFEIVHGTFSRFTTLPKIWLLTKVLFRSREG
jgi:hypothetical protein